MLQITSHSDGAPLRKPWKRGIAVGRAYDLLRADLQEHLRFLQRTIGYDWCRFHAVFHDDMGIVKRDDNGQLAYRWHQLDKVYDFLLSIGLKPFVELNPMPSALASGTQTMFFYQMNVSPPRDYDEWEALVEAFARHCIERYGLEEVRSWNFEVWNEPNLSAFWSGTRDEYFQLYLSSAKALKRVDAGLRVGGPASSKANWLPELMSFCEAQNAPLDFLSTHLYPQDEYVDWEDREGSPHVAGEFFADTFRAAREVVPAHLPLHWTEWNTQSTVSSAGITWGDNEYVDNAFAASFIAKNCVELDTQCDSMCWWVASDIFEEGGIPHAPFSATYGLLTVFGLPKASFHAFALLNRLRGNRADVKFDDAPEGCGAVATCEGDTTYVLAWNHPPLENKAKPNWRDTLCWSGAGPWAVTRATVAAGNGSAYESWIQMGRPQNLSPAQEKFLEFAATPKWESSRLVTAAQRFDLGPYQIAFWEIRPAGPSALATHGAEFATWDAGMGEKSRE